MKGKILVFALVAVGVLAAGLYQKRNPCKGALTAGITGLLLLKRLGRQLWFHMAKKSVAAALLVGATRWMCQKVMQIEA